MSSSVTLERVSKLFGRLKALDEVSLEIKSGEVFTLLGPSGCGKTSTLRLIAGLEEPDSGRIIFGNKVVASVQDRIFVPAHKRNLGMVFQSYAIWPHMTVFENVGYPLKVRRLAKSELREKVMSALDLVGLGGLETRQVTQLSGGQQQRVALARALIHEPDLLLLDEPFSNLDSKLREQMRIQLKLLLKKLEITVVFVTHDQAEALSLSDRVALMNAGRLEQLGAPQDLYEKPASSFVRDFLGRTVLLNAVVTDPLGNGHLGVSLDGILQGPKLSATPVGCESLRPNQKVFAAIRPEDVCILPLDTTDKNHVIATVEALLFVGDHYECRLKLTNEQLLLAYAPRSARLREGDTVKLGMPTDAISIWPS